MDENDGDDSANSELLPAVALNVDGKADEMALDNDRISSVVGAASDCK